eukprot:m.266147 g.266147  ORF g.266147 m.266147 type:complete len:453 (-) comp30123_c0_seq1:31-1389(-)
MSFRVVRQSKYRHVFGESWKKDKGYDGVRISRNAWDSPFCTVNPKFIGVVLEAQGGGAFTVINIEKVGRVDLNAPKVCGHTQAVLDIQFCPYNDYVIASCSEDCTVKVWEIPDGGLTSNLTEAAVTLMGHQRRVGIVEWHPHAENILASAGFDYMVFIWDISKGEAVRSLDMHSDTIYSMSWNPEGTLMATTSKDKIVRVIDPRAGKVVSEGKGHAGTKAARVTFTTEGKLFTTGFSRMSERQYAVWDINDMSKPLKIEMIDTSSGVLFIYYDPDTQTIYLAGKGDGNIRYYEVTDEAPYVYYISEFKSSAPQRGLGLMPKRGVDVGSCEIVRFFKLHPKGFIEVIGFKVPRKSTLFQEDIFPPTKEDVAVLKAEEWLSGTDRMPGKISLKDGYKPPARAQLAVEVKQDNTPKEDQPPKGEKELLKAWHEHRKIIKDLKAQIATLEIKLRTS